MSLKIRSETEFKARFPDAGAYAKSDEGCYATFLPEGSGISVLEPWGPDGAATLEEARGGRDVLLLNLPVNEVYPCRLSPKNGNPEGYCLPSWFDPSRACVTPITVQLTPEPILAVQLDEAMAIHDFENEVSGNVHECPATGWLAYSESKGLYHIKDDKFRKMQYAPV